MTSDRFWISTRKGLFCARRTRTGPWRLQAPHFLGAGVSLAAVDPRDQTVYACLEHGHFGVKLHASRDGGKTWAELPAPKFPPRKRGEIKQDAWGRPWKHSVQAIWALEIDPRMEGGLWCGTVPGGLFHSADGGRSWSLVRGLWDRPERARWSGGGRDLPAIHSICVDPRDAERVLVGVSVGGAWLTEDGGATWAVASHGMRAEFLPPELARDPIPQDPHRIVQCPAAPRRLWCQHHNGIFQSRNGGTRWTEIRKAGPSTFGFAVAVHPQDPDTAWFVPGVKDECRVAVDGRLVVTRTRDGGKSFDVLRAGLPQRHAYDVVLRHAMDVAACGKRLAFGTTTGSVFTTDNGGSRWQALSNHLPPVHAVAFG